MKPALAGLLRAAHNAEATASPTSAGACPSTPLTSPTIGLTGLEDDYPRGRSEDSLDRPEALRVTSLQLGTPVRTVADRLGHSSPTVTLDVYGHRLAGDDEAAATTFATLLQEPPTGTDQG